MSYEIVITKKFKNDIKFYKKKFAHIEDDLDFIIEKLEQGEFIGTPLEDVDANNKTYKVRIANSDTKMGKSNGYRLVYYAVTDNLEIYLLTVYYKKDDKNIPSNNEIKRIIEQYCT
ncbi:hypothetical protein [Anaerovorax sp. IOR16]|uniref:hypothetical protein n=1 Tax=Anaerovorax sp. IOR16 TaxID=2773458 RepID=UPI0019D2112A|nr:hypothetical protein [Anaerovorax sp. IOR16]